MPDPFWMIFWFPPLPVMIIPNGIGFLIPAQCPSGPGRLGLASLMRR